MEYVLKYNSQIEKMEYYQVKSGNGETWLRSIPQNIFELDWVTSQYVNHVAMEIGKAVEKAGQNLQSNETPRDITVRFGVEANESFRKRHDLISRKKSWIPEIKE